MSAGSVKSLISRRKSLRWLLILIVGLLAPNCAPAGGPKTLQIGMAKTFFTDRPKSMVAIATDDFKEFLEKTANLQGDLVAKYDVAEVAEKLNNKQLDLGVFHGHEFAAVQKKYPDFRPLLVAVNKHHDERGYLVIHKKSMVQSVADLKGKSLDIPKATREQCRAFIAKLCADQGQATPAKFFSAITMAGTQEAALDNVARGKTEAALVDTIGLEFYKEIKGPVYTKNLKILVKSVSFPPAVVVSKKGGLSEEIVTRFRDSMLKAQDSTQGRELMEMLKISAFEPIPKDFEKSLADILKAYPQAVSLH